MKFEDMFSMTDLIDIGDAQSVDQRAILSVEYAPAVEGTRITDRVIVRMPGEIALVLPCDSPKAAFSKANEIKRQVNESRAFIRDMLTKMLNKGGEE